MLTGSGAMIALGIIIIIVLVVIFFYLCFDLCGLLKNRRILIGGEEKNLIDEKKLKKNVERILNLSQITKGFFDKAESDNKRKIVNILISKEDFVKQQHQFFFVGDAVEEVELHHRNVLDIHLV